MSSSVASLSLPVMLRCIAAGTCSRRVLFPSGKISRTSTIDSDSGADSEDSEADTGAGAGVGTDTGAGAGAGEGTGAGSGFGVDSRASTGTDISLNAANIVSRVRSANSVTSAGVRPVVEIGGSTTIKVYTFSTACLS